jgi:hypothetical protein
MGDARRAPESPAATVVKAKVATVACGFLGNNNLVNNSEDLDP